MKARQHSPYREDGGYDSSDKEDREIRRSKLHNEPSKTPS